MPAHKDRNIIIRTDKEVHDILINYSRKVGTSINGILREMLGLTLLPRVARIDRRKKCKKEKDKP